jgi:hypothetical protein
MTKQELSESITIPLAEYEQMKKDAERLETLMDMSSRMYEISFNHHLIGRLREFIDANKETIDKAKEI